MRLHLVDGTYELFRAHFSQQPERASARGEPIKATVGLVSSILSLLADPVEQVTHLAVAFDNPIRSFRNELFDGYKTEEGVPPELLAQFDAVERAVGALGLTVWSMKEWEADDAIATAAQKWSPVVSQVRILSPDKDFGQCLRERRVVQVDRRRKKELDEQGLRALRGIGPASIPDWLALIGDVADGIPGLAGFGEKTASVLLARYEHLEQIPRNARAWPAEIRGADRLAQTLAAAQPEVLLYRKLATLVTDVPLPQPLEDLRWQGVPKARFEAWCDSLGLTDLKSRPSLWSPVVEGG
jgi:5'-3' exonuclease